MSSRDGSCAPMIFWALKFWMPKVLDALFWALDWMPYLTGVCVLEVVLNLLFIGGLAILYAYCQVGPSDTVRSSITRSKGFVRCFMQILNLLVHLWFLVGKHLDVFVHSDVVNTAVFVEETMDVYSFKSAGVISCLKCDYIPICAFKVV